jgi:Fe-Mn family superoxide dismutase
MPYETKNFEHLLGIRGLSENLLKNHFTLYKGYVDNTNKLIEEFKTLFDEGKTGTPEYAEMKRRFGWEFNGMRLHEYYFENLSKEEKTIDKNSDFYKKILETHGSYENWEKFFRAAAGMRGIGWVILYYDKIGDRLFNVWVNEHDVGHFSGCAPLLVMDVFEHAYMLDYGVKKADYIEAFLKIIDWDVVSKRFNAVK